MRDPLLDWREGGCVAREGDELLPIGEVRGEPVECSALSTLFTQYLKEDGMVHSIKGCAKV